MKTSLGITLIFLFVSIFLGCRPNTTETDNEGANAISVSGKTVCIRNHSEIFCHFRSGRDYTSLTATPATLVIQANADSSFVAAESSVCVNLTGDQTKCIGRKLNGPKFRQDYINFEQLEAGPTKITGETLWCGLSFTPFDKSIIDCWDNSSSESILKKQHPWSTATEIAVGDELLCIISEGGELVCQPNPTQTPRMRRLLDSRESFHFSSPSLNAVQEMCVGHYHVCALGAQGTADCWYRPRIANYRKSRRSFGMFKVPSVKVDREKIVGQAKVPNRSFEMITCGKTFSCGLTESSKVLCWGEPPNSKSLPSWSDVRDLSSGDGSTCVVKQDGEVDCWGSIEGKIPRRFPK